MVHITSTRASQLNGATIRALSSLTRRDADAVRATVRAAATHHSVQEHDDYDGYLSLLITPENDVRPSYMVAGRTGAVDVAELCGDEMTTVGTFPSIGAAMIVLRPALERTDEDSIAMQAAALLQRHGDDAGLHVALRADAKPGQEPWPSILRAIDESDRS